MRTLVLCVDRDDDFGKKAHIFSPIIGREYNLHAAMKLGLADPEESDMNAVMAAVSVYDNLKEKDEDVEVATICGDPSVGIKSDEVIATQLEMVIEKTEPDEVIVVTDGAEDEFLLPIIMSRIKVRSVKRVVVKQSKNIESAYYFLIKALSDDTIAKRFLAPLGLISLAYGLSVLFVLMTVIYFNGLSNLEAGTFSSSMMFITLGLYLLNRCFRLKDRLITKYKVIKRAFTEAHITVVSTMVSIILILVGFKYGLDATARGNDIVEDSFLFLSTFILWFMIAMLVREGGNVLEIHINHKTMNRSLWVSVLFITSIGVLMIALLKFMEIAFGYEEPWSLYPVVLLIVISGALGASATIMQRIRRAEEEGEESAQPVD